MKTVTIRVDGRNWTVPYGFGIEYKAEAQEQLKETTESTVFHVGTFLRLIGYEASEETIRSWSLRKRVEVVVYARNRHMRASDNPLRRHPDLPWLPEPWQGPEREGKFAFDGPTCTKLT